MNGGASFVLSFIPSMVKHQAATRAVLEGSAEAVAMKSTSPVTAEFSAGNVHETVGALVLTFIVTVATVDV